MPAYADRVQELARQWDHVRVHPQAWRRNVPTSSFGVHRFLKAMQLWEGQRERETPHFSDDVPSLFESILWRLRTAFFEEALDIGARDFQDAVAEEYGVPAEELRVIADGGEADAALIADLELKESQQIPGSPTLVLNEGRQRLYGNVGYGVLEANVRELLRDPQFGEASWCR